jgi:hypothetical protein
MAIVALGFCQLAPLTLATPFLAAGANSQSAADIDLHGRPRGFGRQEDSQKLRGD